MALEDDMVSHIISLGHATALGTDIFIAPLPPSPIKAMRVKALGGPEPTYCSSGATPTALESLRWQLQVRDSDLQAARDLAEAVRKALDLNPPLGYWELRATVPQPVDVTSPDEQKATDGPICRYVVEFVAERVRT